LAILSEVGANLTTLVCPVAANVPHRQPALATWACEGAVIVVGTNRTTPSGARRNAQGAGASSTPAPW